MQNLNHILKAYMLTVLFFKLKQKKMLFIVFYLTIPLTPDPVKYTHFVMVVFWLFTYVESRVQNIGNNL